MLQTDEGRAEFAKLYGSLWPLNWRGNFPKAEMVSFFKSEAVIIELMAALILIPGVQASGNLCPA